MVIALEVLLLQSFGHISGSRRSARPCVPSSKTPSASCCLQSVIADSTSLTYSSSIRRESLCNASGSLSFEGFTSFKLGNVGTVVDVNRARSGNAPLSSPSVRFPNARPLNAAIAETAGEGLKWWERNGPPNMCDVNTGKEFVDALFAAGDRLVIVEFFATWCGSCRALYPKLCKVATECNDISFVKVNFDENKRMCKALNVKVLPFFHIYRGASGRLDSFSCSLSKFQKLKDAIAKHHDGPSEDCAAPEPLGDLFTTLLEISPVDKPAGTAASSSV